MSPRYYLITTVLVIVLTVAISVSKQTRSKKQIFLIFCYVVAGLVCLVAAAIGTAQLLVMFGIAESGYIF